ncbi:hypothetical protein [Streptomyces sp. cg35]|uniref:hypothetical protein n=1 Tax=Streptomyces sp. cg35 TaxID=3421650 RepID=UPI003D16F890
MKTDLLAAIDTYATGMQIAMWAGSAVFFAAHLALAWLVIATGRNAWAAVRRAYRSFAAARQLCRDVENEHRIPAPAFTDTRKETQS